ncbi:MAG TPA: type II secretion system F family protein, partial [Geobacterales bacterium]|nr:type II secretion system F family protein [Geobacterales bacterium]
TFRAVIDKVRRDIALGSTFADAIGSHPHVFPTMYIRLVSIGEESGNLDGSLNDVADHLQRVEDLTSAIKNAMIYPIFALVTTMGAMIFWLVYVLPGILTMFKEMKIPIPPVTRFLMWASSFTLTWWPLLVTLPIVTFIGLKAARRWPRAAWRIDLVKLKLPIVQLILINKILALFAEQMRVLLRSGLTIDRSFNLAAEVIDNRVYHEAILQVREEVVTGSAISESLQRQKLFTPMFLRMVHIGETSGSLDDQFAFLAEYYVKRLDEVSQRLGKIIEPVIIIFVGIIFAVIIVGLLLPVYDMISTVGKG